LIKTYPFVNILFQFSSPEASGIHVTNQRRHNGCGHFVTSRTCQ